MFKCDNSNEHTTCNCSQISVQDKHLRSGKSMFVYVSSDDSIGRLRYPYR